MQRKGEVIIGREAREADKEDGRVEGIEEGREVRRSRDVRRSCKREGEGRESLLAGRGKEGRRCSCFITRGGEVREGRGRAERRSGEGRGADGGTLFRRQEGARGRESEGWGAMDLLRRFYTRAALGG